MNERFTLEQEAARAKIIAELNARPGPKPLKPIPPEIMAEILADQTPYEEAERQYKELMENGGHTFEEILAAFDRAAEQPR